MIYFPLRVLREFRPPCWVFPVHSPLSTVFTVHHPLNASMVHFPSSLCALRELRPPCFLWPDAEFTIFRITWAPHRHQHSRFPFRNSRTCPVDFPTRKE